MAFRGDHHGGGSDDDAGFDPQVAGQISSQILTTGQRNFALNGAAARNQLAAVLSVLILGVQQNQAASLNQLSSLGPLAAHSAANLRQSQNVPNMAILRTGARVPRVVA